MKKILKYAIGLIVGGMLMTACSDFDEINIDPKAASAEQVQVEYIINKSIIGAQQNPHVAERAFVLYWKTAARQHRYNGGLIAGGYNDGWSGDYYNSLSDWLKSANLAITISDDKIEAEPDLEYIKNLKQVARIWRVYLMSEFADNFGAMPVDAFNGINPEFKSLKEVYYFLLDELKEASSELNNDLTVPEAIEKFDPAYKYNFPKWQKYANSMRLRLAMRLSEVDEAKAKSEFESAVTGALITTADDNFKVQEKDGWDDLTGVMSRSWNTQPLSATMNNLYLGLGGISSNDLVSDEFKPYVKSASYMGLKLEDHFSTMTNEPSAGFWFDGLPATIDPRAYKTFIIPGDFDNPNYTFYHAKPDEIINLSQNLEGEDDVVIKTINAKGHWNAPALGAWGEKGARNKIASYPTTNPRMSLRFRQSTAQRIFFASWETHFLISEAAVRGWTTPKTAKEAYEEGVKASFQYWDVEEFADVYLASDDYNRVGTSANFDHTTEPPATKEMDFVNGYDGEAGTYTFKYPENHLYENGDISNDKLTKIITQKYIAQMPWLPLEAWNDQRRLGLPFFDNPAVDLPITDLPALNQTNYMTSDIRFFPQRLRYPSSLENSNPDGYMRAVELIGGTDAVLTPLWWAKQQ